MLDRGGGSKEWWWLPLNFQEMGKPFQKLWMLFLKYIRILINPAQLPCMYRFPSALIVHK